MDLARTLLEVGGLILGLGFLGRVAARLNLSPIPLYLLGGLMFGKGGLIPLANSEEFITVGAEVGVILLLFLLGLEYTADDLLKNLRTHYPAGLMDFALNATPGAVVGVILGWPLPGILAMAGITYATSSGIAAKLLGDLGRVGNRETPIVLSLLVFEDLLMAVFLPILTALLAGVGVLGGAVSVMGAVGAVAAVLFFAVRYGGLLNRIVFSPNDELLLLGALGIVLVVAGIAEELHVSTAVGAFLTGIALSGNVAESASSLLTPLRDLFASVFFVFFGLQTDARQIPPVLLVAIGLGLVTTITKIGVGMWAAKRVGISLPGQIRAGTVMVPRGEFNIVVAGLATSAGLPGIGPLSAAYVMLMAVVGPVLTRYADPIARRLTPQPKETPEE